MSNLHTRRNCTGAALVDDPRFSMMQVDHARPPLPTPNPTAPAYPDGWADLAKQAAELGIKGFADAFDSSDYFEPIDHCVRHALADPVVVAWLRTYAAIKAGIRSAPVDTVPVYDSIMLAIHNVIADTQRAIANV